MNVMKRILSSFLGLLAATAAFAAPAAAQSDAKVFVVHGIDGRDIGQPRALPVDVALNGGCALPDLRFGQVIGPISLPAGSYDIDIGLADADSPCSQPPVLSVPSVPLFPGECATIIAHLDENGDITASKFVNDLSQPGFLRGRLLVHHTAAAPPVDALLERLGFFPVPPANPKGLQNGRQLPAELFFGLWRGSIQVSGTSTTVLGPGLLFLLPRTVDLLYVVGSASNGTLSVIRKRVFV